MLEPKPVRRWGVVVTLAAILCAATASHATTSVALLGRVTAKAAVLVDNHTGQTLFARSPDLQLPPASTTKILTAFIALRSDKVSRAFRVSPYASSMQPSKIGLRPGWLMGVQDLTYAVLLNSANDASVVLAEGLAGSVRGFARMMNQTAQQLGAVDSRFVNPNGLPADGHYSTARDLTTIMRHALRVPTFREIISTRETVIRPHAGSRRRIVLRSHNRLLDNQDVRDLGIRVIGKTGWTRKARRCFVGAFLNDEKEILVAVLGADDLWGDLRRLIDYAFHVPARKPHLATDNDWRHAAKAPFPAPSVRKKASGEGDQPSVRYHVQLASLRSRVSADRLRRKAAGLGYRAVVEPFRTGRRTLYRVTVRSFGSRAAADKAARTLARSCRVRPLVITERT